MSITERDVITALQQSVISAVAQSSIPTLPIKFLNVRFTVPDDGKWIELIHIPNPPSDQTWNDEKIFRGIYRLILHWSNDGGGSYDAFTYADSIMMRYSKSNKLNEYLQLLRQPRLTTVGEDGKDLMLVISLEYSTFSW